MYLIYGLLKFIVLSELISSLQKNIFKLKLLSLFDFYVLIIIIPNLTITVVFSYHHCCDSVDNLRGNGYLA